MSDSGAPSILTALSTDLTELIFSFLPIPSLLRASSVCKLWHHLIVFDPSFTILHLNQNQNRPWLFLCGLHNTSSKNHQSFAFDPASNAWFRVPIPGSLSSLDPSSSISASSNGQIFTTAPSFASTRFFTRRRDSSHAPLRFPRINPLIAGNGRSGLIVAGGVRFIGGLVDIEDRLAVEIYNPRSCSWELGPPLPEGFRSGNSSQSLSSALFGGRFYVFGIYSCFVSCFDLEKRVWSDVRVLKPPGVVFSFLIACEDMIVLAGLSNSEANSEREGGGLCFCLWRVREETMELLCEIGAMPRELLYGLVDEEEDDKFASLKCVGSGRLLYVFNEEYHKKYPACVCEIVGGGEAGYGCRWRRLPRLPSPVNKFHKVISFCSTVSLASVLRGDGEEVF